MTSDQNQTQKPSQNTCERAVAFIPVRLSSSRLPEKHFRKIGDRTVLEWLIDNLKKSEQLDEIVIATAAEAANEPLKAFCQQHDLPLFWYEGHIDHVTTRLRLAAELYQADICLLISGDCPLVHGPTIDLLIKEFRKEPKADILVISTDNHIEKHPALEGVLISRLHAWQTADDLADRPELKEHQFPLFWQRPELFIRHNVSLPENLHTRKHRFSVDTWADLEFMNTLYDRLVENNQNFQLPEVLQLLKKEPQLFKINEHVHQRRLIDDNLKVLFVVDAGVQYGYGHVRRCLELARQMTERKGWSTVFAVDDNEAIQILNREGEKTVWAAFHRPTRGEKQNDQQTFQKLLSDSNLLVLDIYDQRGADVKWRNQLPEELSVIAIGNTLPWTEMADLLIMPGTYHIPERMLTLAQEGKLHLLHGMNSLILRREVTKQHPVVKDLDLVAYLHNPQARRDVESFIDKHGLQGIVLHSHCEKLPVYMARTKLYLSGFGISSYEAIALKAMPVIWPHSKVNRCDALDFFNMLNLSPAMLQNSSGLSTTILPLLKETDIILPEVHDNSAWLVEQISCLPGLR